ncbi:hypothetical protein [uncultured Cyclobacterium sp.]|uniref:hypothetical protein n=1 Tax=uncultured Cyclobacterium sp. TaxID=453820 RepID=UPI0030ECC1CA
MINQNEYELRGFYKPHFFALYINGRYDPDLNNLSTPDLGTFAHEYVHYLQNITTIFGLRNSVFYFRYLYELKSHIAKNSAFELPLKNVDIDFTENLKRGKQLFDQYYGTKETLTVGFDEVKVSLKKRGTSKIPCLQLYYNGKLVKSVLVGNLCVKEGMAHLIQSLYDPEVKHDTFPYLAVEILCEHLNPKMAEDKRKLISACLIALNSQNSGLTLYETLLNEQSDISGKALYEKLLSEHKVIYQSKEISIREFILSSIEEFRTALSNSIYAELNHFNKLLDNVKWSVNEGICPLLETLYDDSGVAGLHGLIDFYGIPYIRTIDGYQYFPPEILDSTQEQIANELLDLMGQSIVLDRVLELNESAPMCSFYAICQLDETDVTDDHCFSTQWKRSTPCLFKIVSDNWQLNEKIKCG